MDTQKTLAGLRSRTCFVLLILLSLQTIAAASDEDWPSYGHDNAGTHFSALTQIDKGNVSQLRVAWTYHAGINRDVPSSSMESNPLIVGGVMYVVSPELNVIALEAATGREIWKFDPFPERQSYARAWTILGICVVFLTGALWLGFRLFRSHRSLTTPSQAILPLLILSVNWFDVPNQKTWSAPAKFAAKVMRHVLPDPGAQERFAGPNRGLTYWQDDAGGRIFFAGGRRLVALNASDGRPIESFGSKGTVDLAKDLGSSADGLVFAVTSPGTICRNAIVIGSMVGEGPDPSVPGSIQAFDLKTGRRKWIFHLIPQPGEAGYETWPPDAWKHVGGANSWGGMTADEARGLVFVPTGSATFDFYGGDRAGTNLYSDSLLAMDADTGKLVWHYQMTHHDLWDYDLPCPPNLVTVQHDGAAVDAVVQPLKNGLIFVLNRETGQPLFPVEERPVPSKSLLEGEQAWPTQPFPLKPPPLSRMEIGAGDLTNLTPEAHSFAVQKFGEVSGAKAYDPPSKAGTIMTPGIHGGATWGGASVDPRTARLVINTNDIPYLLQIQDAKPGAGYRYGFNGFIRFLDPNGYPAIRPPWGNLSAVDLQTGEIAWQVPLGEYPELTARGIPPTGTENAGGSVITGSGLVFIAATRDAKFRAFDVDSGKVLWETKLDAGGFATPSTYSVKGKQYVVITAGGGSMVEGQPNDEIVAFALPDRL